MAIVVDYSHLIYRNIFANKKDIVNNPDFLSHLILTSLFSIIKKFGVHKEKPLILAFDCKRENSWRHAFYAKEGLQFDEYTGRGYKAHRTKDPSFPWEEMYTVLSDLKEMLKSGSDVQVIEHPMAEGDDIVYVSTKFYPETTIVSSDKDFRQLLSPRVKIFDPLKKAYIEEDNPKNFLIEHILTGDVSDGILGLPKPKNSRGERTKVRIGEKTAKKYVSELEFLLADADLRARYNFNKTLIDLSEIPAQIESEIIDAMKEPQFNWNQGNAMKFFMKYRLAKLFSDIKLLKATTSMEEKGIGTLF